MERRARNTLNKPTKRSVIQFIWFNAGGLAFFAIGYLVFVVLYGLFHWSWLPAKMLADFLGWLANFAIQYFVAFRKEHGGNNTHIVAGKFTAISLVNLLIDYAIVGLLNWFGISPFIGLFVAASFFTVWKWLWYKHWVFRVKPEIRK